MIVDRGSAPNPFGGICTLALCKPQIRKYCEIGDWVLGFGSKQLDHENKMIYAMKVDDKMTFEEYDKFCNNQYRIKLPEHSTQGDCILYKVDCSNTYKQRENVLHTYEIIQHEISSEFVLLSKQYYYFGDNAVEIPQHINPISPIGRGYQSVKNQQYVNEFEEWINTFEIGIHGYPNNFQFAVDR